ncbi:MAG: anthranilate synthase component I family protein [Mariniblastus sp.]
MTQTSDQPKPARKLADTNLQFQPAIAELSPAPSVEMVLEKMADLDGCLLLDSSMAAATRKPNASTTQAATPKGRYSFLMADPFETIVHPVGAKNPLEEVQTRLGEFKIQTVQDLPPMQGGIAGLFSYDLNQSFEKIPSVEDDSFQVPAIAVGLYDSVVAWDHEQDRCWIVSQGLPETDLEPRKSRAESRLKFFREKIFSKTPPPTNKPPSTFNRMQVPGFAVDRIPKLKSNFSRQGYLAAVQKCIDYIHAGDVFQINLAQRLLYPAECSSVELFKRLRQCNPAPFSGYFDISRISSCAAQIISASPERFFSVEDGLVETRPIKGTRPRTGRPMVDLRAKDELLASVKDRAENTMIVDLMRNDLSRVCEDDSIQVTQFCELEEYQSVLHLVSAVEGRLKEDSDLVDLLNVIFPGGSITGAPKVRAMEIIAELEPTARGAYCGSLGYLGFDGSADSSILIRTITASQGWWQIPVGGGIVSQSDPEKEYAETWTKAAGMLRAVTMDGGENG